MLDKMAHKVALVTASNRCETFLPPWIEESIAGLARKLKVPLFKVDIRPNSESDGFYKAMSKPIAKNSDTWSYVVVSRPRQTQEVSDALHKITQENEGRIKSCSLCATEGIDDIESTNPISTGKLESDDFSRLWTPLQLPLKSEDLDSVVNELANQGLVNRPAKKPFRADKVSLLGWIEASVKLNQQAA